MSKFALASADIAYLYDSHAHLSDSRFDADRDAVVARAVEAGVEMIVDVATHPAHFEKLLSVARSFPDHVRVTLGIDPEVLVPHSDFFMPALLTMSQAEFERWCHTQTEAIAGLVGQHSELVCGIGEIGMDEHWLARQRTEGQITAEQYQESLARQRHLCAAQLALAAHLSLPVTLHSRGAESACLELVRNYPAAVGVFHSYTGDYATAKGILDRGWSLGVNGIVTFSNALELRETYKQLLGNASADWSPQDFYRRGVVFETDAPYLAPQGKRGQRNEPVFVRDIFAIFRQNSY